uniref:Metalloendopeptidase n=1 Tax=Pachycerianthus borealis TaxID=2736680 RepID=A0A7G7WYP2_9CNID|nr:toxin candidate TRINITY_DN16728_c0_g1_i2 [Pachycerianthus borealis]
MGVLKVFVLLGSLLIAQQIQGKPNSNDDGGKSPPAPNRNKFDLEEIIALENTRVEGRKEDQTDLFDLILRANRQFKNSKVARTAKVSLYQGDIIGNDETDEMEEAEIGSKEGGSRKKRAVIRERRYLWSKVGSRHVIPYVITSSNYHAKSKIIGAMGEWMTKVPCLQFVQRSNQRAYLSFFSGGGCYSMVGMQGGKQAISIGRGCEHHGVIVHEIGHALGFWHEQSRPDRDSYVRINRGAIQRGMEHNFNKYTTAKINSYGQAYDFGSVMHYGAYAFSSGRTPTITRINGQTTGLGQRNGLGAGDVIQAKLMYCGGTGPQPTSGPQPTGCQGDKSGNCGSWASRGFCKDARYKKYMEENCCKSCKVPDPTTAPPPCVNKHGNEKCNRWTLDGLCKIAPCFMLKECCRSCKNPPTTSPPTTAAAECKDLKPVDSCTYWESTNFCESSSKWYSFMTTNCRKTCGFC